MSIRHVSFKHGWFYHYRLHEEKASQLCNNGFLALKKYLELMFEQCPDEKFSTTLRSSALKMNVGVNTTLIENHQISYLAAEGLDWNKYKTAHSNVQLFMLQNDDKTLGVEVPIWMDSTELNGYENIFNSKESLSGHIDLLQVDKDKIWVWDFKPKASKEKYATTQVYFYALMLSKRTGIPLNKFMCGYFDELTAYIFDPTQNTIRLVQ